MGSDEKTRDLHPDLQQELSHQLTDIVQVERRVAALEQKNDELRQDIKDVIVYLELINARIPGIRQSFSAEQANVFNDAFTRLNARYGRHTHT